MRAPKASLPEIRPPIESANQPSLPSLRADDAGLTSDDALVGLLRRIQAAVELFAERTTELGDQVRRLEKQLSVVAAGHRLFLNLQEAAETLGVDQKALRPLLHNASQSTPDPSKLNYVPKGGGKKAIKRIHRGELERFAFRWWHESLTGPKPASDCTFPSNPGLPDPSAPDPDQSEVRPVTELPDRGDA